MFSQLEYNGFQQQFYYLQASAWVLAAKVSATVLTSPLAYIVRNVCPYSAQGFLNNPAKQIPMASLRAYT
jgi:hypothetical protein